VAAVTSTATIPAPTGVFVKAAAFAANAGKTIAAHVPATTAIVLIDLEIDANIRAVGQT
jgi:hypothetical protein